MITTCQSIFLIYSYWKYNYIFWSPLTHDTLLWRIQYRSWHVKQHTTIDWLLLWSNSWVRHIQLNELEKANLQLHLPYVSQQNIAQHLYHTSINNSITQNGVNRNFQSRHRNIIKFTANFNLKRVFESNGTLCFWPFVGYFDTLKR